MATKAVVILSGGMDSTVVLAEALNRFGSSAVDVLSFYYGQRHAKELTAAGLVASCYGAPSLTVDLCGRGAAFEGVPAARLMVGGALTGGMPVPHGHYEAPSMSQTVVPNRNMIFIAFAVARAVQLGASEVWYGAHAGDHAIYPDCRPAFVFPLSEAVRHATGILLNAPFLTESKVDIVRRGTNLSVPFELTWSCYEGGELHCGKCGTCVERKEAFTKAGVKDPTLYEA